MQRSTIQVTKGNQFVTDKIAPAVVVFTTTIAAFVMAFFRQKDTTQGILVIDRANYDVNGKARVCTFPSANLPTVAGLSGSSLVKLVGARVANGVVRFGVGAVTPAALAGAIDGAVEALDIAGEIDPAVDAEIIKAIVVPTMGETTLKSVLDKMFDLIPTLRDNDVRVCARILQGADSGEVEFFTIDEADVNDLHDGLNSGSESPGVETEVDFLITPPETASVAAATPRYFAE